METKDFLNPTSMMTPGIAGAMTTGLTMPLVFAFDLKYKWVALVLSLVISYLVVSAYNWNLSRIESVAYWLLNSLIIFSVSVGAGVNINQPPDVTATEMDPTIKAILMKLNNEKVRNEEKLGSTFWISSAYAASGNEQNYNLETPQHTSQERVSEQAQEPRPLSDLSEEEIKTLQHYFEGEKKYIQQQQQYKKRWSW